MCRESRTRNVGKRADVLLFHSSDWGSAGEKIPRRRSLNISGRLFFDNFLKNGKKKIAIWQGDKNMGKKIRALKEVFSFHLPRRTRSLRDILEDLLYLFKICLDGWKEILMRKRKLLPTEQLTILAAMFFWVGSICSLMTAALFGKSLLATIPLLIGSFCSIWFLKAALKIPNYWKLFS